MRLSLKALATTVFLLCLGWRPVAAAQSVVVLEFAGDKNFKVRAQVLGELKENSQLTLVPLPDFKKAAKKKGLKGRRAMSPAAVEALAPTLKYNAAVSGVVSRKAFAVRIIDTSGNDLWSKELPVSGGKISAANAKRLGAAIAAAVGVSAGSAPADEPEDTPEPTASAPEPADTDQPDASVTDTPTADPGPAVALPTPKIDNRSSARDRDSHTTTEVDEDLRNPDGIKKKGVGPKLISLQVAGTTTWRRYCSRPGVKSCREYDQLAPGTALNEYFIDVSQQTPYFGVWLGVDVFPLSSNDSAIKGLGLMGSYSRGFSVTSIRNAGAASAAATDVVSDDEAYFAQATYRYYLAVGKKEALPAYAGIRAGLAGRSFAVDESQQLLHGSTRSYPIVGLDVSYPLVAAVRIEVSGSYFFNPAAGEDEIARYGTAATGAGYMVEAGLGGDLWGPFGYTLRFKLNSYKDQFTGAGSAWSQGGAAEESYTGVYWGATANF